MQRERRELESPLDRVSMGESCFMAVGGGAGGAASVIAETARRHFSIHWGCEGTRTPNCGSVKDFERSTVGVSFWATELVYPPPSRHEALAGRREPLSIE